jgi:hypothetical protein
MAFSSKRYAHLADSLHAGLGCLAAAHGALHAAAFTLRRTWPGSACLPICCLRPMHSFLLAVCLQVVLVDVPTGRERAASVWQDGLHQVSMQGDLSVLHQWPG